MALGKGVSSFVPVNRSIRKKLMPPPGRVIMLEEVSAKCLLSSGAGISEQIKYNNNKQ